MNTFSTQSTVNRQEAEALKEMIFNRVRARAEAMSQDVQNSCVDNFQNELMDLARTSLSVTKNPFSVSVQQAVNQAQLAKEGEAVNLEQAENTNHDISNIVPAETTYLVSQIKQRTISSNEEITKAAIASTIDDTRRGLENKSTFMGALNFLNSQASIAIVNKTGKRFEANV